MLTFIGISILILVLIKLEILIKVKGYAYVYDNDYGLRLFLFGVCIFTIAFKNEPDENSRFKFVIYLGKKRKRKELTMQKDKKNKNSVSVGDIMPLLSNLLISELGFDAQIGTKDAFKTTIAMGALKILFYSGISYIKSRQNLNIYEKFTPVYNADTIKIDFYGILNISIADIIYSFISDRIRRLGKSKGRKSYDYRAQPASD